MKARLNTYQSQITITVTKVNDGCTLMMGGARNQIHLSFLCSQAGGAKASISRLVNISQHLEFII